MGFKINKGKSWKNLGDKTQKKTFSKENMSSIDNSSKQVFSKKNMSSVDHTWDNTTKNLKEDTRKSVKAAGKGIKRTADDMADNMTFWIVLGGGIFGFVAISSQL